MPLGTALSKERGTHCIATGAASGWGERSTSVGGCVPSLQQCRCAGASSSPLGGTGVSGPMVKKALNWIFNTFCSVSELISQVLRSQPESSQSVV